MQNPLEYNTQRELYGIRVSRLDLDPAGLESSFLPADDVNFAVFAVEFWRIARNLLHSRGSFVDSRSCLVVPGCCESRKFRCTCARPGRNVRNLLGSRSIPFAGWSREDSSSCADCTKSASLAVIAGEWCEICSVREQFLLLVCKRLTKTTVSLKVNRHFVSCIIAV